MIIATLLLEVDLTHRHYSRSKLVAVPFFQVRETNDTKSLVGVFQLFIVVNGLDSCLSLRDIGIVIDVISQETLGLQVRNKWLEQLVEDMVRSLDFLLLGDTRLLKQIGLNVTTTKFARGSEVNPDEFTKTRGVVIPRGLGIAIRFQDRVSSHNLVFKRHLLGLLSRRGHHGQVGNDLLGVFGLASSRLSSDQHGLILTISQHVTIGSFSNSPQVRWNLIPPFAQIHLHHSAGVDWEPLVRVHNNTEQTRVGVDELGLVPGLQVPKDRGIIEKGQVSHVFTLLKLGWIDLANLIRLVGLFL